MILPHVGNFTPRKWIILQGAITGSGVAIWKSIAGCELYGNSFALLVGLDSNHQTILWFHKRWTRSCNKEWRCRHSSIYKQSFLIEWSSGWKLMALILVLGAVKQIIHLKHKKSGIRMETQKITVTLHILMLIDCLTTIIKHFLMFCCLIHIIPCMNNLWIYCISSAALLPLWSSLDGLLPGLCHVIICSFRQMLVTDISVTPAILTPTLP